MANPTRSAPASTAWAGAAAAVVAAVAAAGRTVVVAGASGLVGREILQGLLADESVVAVHSLGRRELMINANAVAHTLLEAVPRVMGKQIPLSGQMRRR